MKKSKICYAFDLNKSCINCLHWQDIGKTQEVKGRNFDDKAVINRIGKCPCENLTTEKYSCRFFKSKVNIPEKSDKLGLYISLGIIFIQVFIMLWILSFKR